MFTYNGVEVALPQRITEVDPAMLPNGRFSSLVQRILDETPPWEGEGTILEARFPNRPILPTAVKLPADAEPVWGIHIQHSTKRLNLSPFIDGEPTRAALGWITLQLSGTPQNPAFVRAYGGQYVPGLPWMSHIHRNRGPREESRRYWKDERHAYLGTHFIKPGTRTSVPPAWFTSQS